MGNFRIRDPIHGLVVFKDTDPIDCLAGKLIDTPEFQRMRRIKQLGVSEFVFPGATHSRFAHSIGVFHCARNLSGVVENMLPDNEKDPYRKQVTLIAALLHDLGHGPFSHAFEEARKSLAKERDEVFKRHELLTADIITAEDGAIGDVLADANIRDSFGKDVADLIRAEDPKDLYHAIVSSSFDADRLDYLARDRYMTGTKAGSIDEDWLLNNLRTWDLEIGRDAEEVSKVRTLAFDQKARQAAEDFLLARHRLYSQVYLHKKTRGIEQLLKALLLRIGQLAETPEKLGLTGDNPLIEYLLPNRSKIKHFKLLDDCFLWGCFRLIGLGAGQIDRDQDAAILANRLLDRQRIFCLDLSVRFSDPKVISGHVTELEELFKDQMDRTVFLDSPSLGAYGPRSVTHKQVRVFEAGQPKEITELNSPLLQKSLTLKRSITRFYFLNQDDKEKAEKAIA